MKNAGTKSINITPRLKVRFINHYRDYDHHERKITVFPKGHITHVTPLAHDSKFVIASRKDEGFLVSVKDIEPVNKPRLVHKPSQFGSKFGHA